MISGVLRHYIDSAHFRIRGETNGDFRPDKLVVGSAANSDGIVDNDHRSDDVAWATVQNAVVGKHDLQGRIFIYIRMPHIQGFTAIVIQRQGRMTFIDIAVGNSIYTGKHAGVIDPGPIYSAGFHSLGTRMEGTEIASTEHIRHSLQWLIVVSSDHVIVVGGFQGIGTVHKAELRHFKTTLAALTLMSSMVDKIMRPSLLQCKGKAQMEQDTKNKEFFHSILPFCYMTIR